MSVTFVEYYEENTGQKETEFRVKSYYDKNSKLIEYDKLIEVKTTRSSSPRFFWSSNEIKVAQREGEKYWIYLWYCIWRYAFIW